MKPRRISRKNLLAGCSEIGPGDGIDPRWDRTGQDEWGKVTNRKALQLCGQIARTLACVFPDLGDDLLRELQVQSVVPAPNSSRVLVSLEMPALSEQEDPSQVQTELYLRLERVRGLLRSEVASAIHRRRTPDLLFRVLLPGQ